MAAGLNVQLRSDYWADASARAAFKRFLVQIFQIDVEPWDATGYWDEDYHPFSLFADDGRIIASACLYSMRMIIAGRAARIGQVSGMGVLPEFRRRGLGQQLSDVALRWGRDHGHHSFMLFSSEEALPFYRAQGFTLTPEHRPVLRLTGEAALAAEPRSADGSGMRALDMTEPADRDLLFRLAAERCPVSQQIGVLNERVVMFHALISRGPQPHYIPSLNVAVMFRRRESVLTLYDVVGSRLPNFAELAPFLIAPSDREVVFWFMTDRFPDLSEFGSLEHRPLEGNNLHLQGSFPVTSPLVFPFTSQA